MSNGNGETLFNQLSDPNHPLRQREWDAFLERRQMLFDDIMSKIGLVESLIGVELEQDPIQSIDSAAIVEAQERMRVADEIASEKPDKMRERDYQQILGQAIGYGIPNPEEIPLGELQQMIEHKRVQRRVVGLDEEDENFLETMALGFGGPIAIGSIDALTRTAETLPFLGRWLSNVENVQWLNRTIGLLREAQYGHLSKEEQRGAAMLEALGGIAGYFIPARMSWQVAGSILGAARLGGATKIVSGTVTSAAGKVLGRTTATLKQPVAWGLNARNPILFNGIKGGLTISMLEAGGDGPISEKTLNIALGTGLGFAIGAGGPVAAGTLGAVGGAVIGNAADEPIAGAIIGAGVALAGHRVYRAYSRNSGLFDSKYSSYHETSIDRMLPWGNPRRSPDIRIPPRGLPPEVHTPELFAAPSRTRLGTPEGPRGLLPEVTLTGQQVERYSYRGTRTLFYGGNESPNALMQRWSTLEQTGLSANDGYTNRIVLDNTGKMLPGQNHVYEVEARFDNLFVLTPESAPIFRQLTRGAQDLDGIQFNLRNVGFDGLAVQGVDEATEFVGTEVLQQQLGLPSAVMSDQVVAFGTPYQVRLSRPVVDGDLLDEAFMNFGSTAGRQVAAVQATTFGREVEKNLRPFNVGENQIPNPPQWLSENRGVRFIRAEGEGVPEAPPGIESAILQHHETFGPRVLLLDSDRIAKATIPVGSIEEGTETLSRLGFQHMDPNSQEEALKLAYTMSNVEKMANNSLAHIVGQIENPTPTDLLVISYADSPGRLSVVNDVGDPFEILRNLREVSARYGQIMDFDQNILIVERPAGTMNAIVGPKDLLTSQIEKQFKNFGVFSGMEASTASGSTIRVNSVWREGNRERASISPLFSDIKATVPLDYIIPGRTTTAVPLTGDIYNKFKNYSLAQFNKEAKEAGLELATELSDPRVLSFVDKYIEEYGAKFGLETAYELERFAGALEWNLARDIQRLAGKDGELFQAQLKESANQLTKETLQGRTLVADLEELAMAKGFIWEPPWRGKPGQLVDQMGNTVIPFQERISAVAFLKNFHRDQSGMDLTPLDASPMQAFQSFDSHATKSENFGVEFVTQADEIKSVEGTLRRAAAETDQFAAQVDEAIEMLAAVEGLPEPEINLGETFSGETIITPPPGGGGAPPPPPPTSPRVAAGEPDPRRHEGDPLWEALKRGGSKRLQQPEKQQVENMLEQFRTTFGDHPERVRELHELMHRPLVRMTATVRTATQIFDDVLIQQGIDKPTMFQNFDNLLQSKSIATNEAQPWIRELWQTLAPFRRGDRRLGQLYDVMTAPTYPDGNLLARTGFINQQDLMLSEHNFDASMRRGIEQLRDLMDRLHQEAAEFTDIGYIWDYLPKMRYFLDLHGDKGWQAWLEALPDNIKWFATYARDGNLQAYHKDVGRVLESYIRGLHFEKHVRVHFEKAQAVWTDPRVPDPLRDYAGNVLYVVRHGHPKGHDGMVRGITSGFNHISDISNSILGTPKAHITEGETLSALGTLMTAQYRGLLGNSPRTNIREFYQPMLAAPELGIGHMVRSYSNFITNPETRRDWTERALKYGWAEPNRNAVANAEFFTGELKDAIGRSAFSTEVSAGREFFASKWDRIYDTLPNAIKNGIEGNPFLDPLWSYRKFATNPGRIIAGNAGYTKAMDAIQAFRIGKIDFNTMLYEANAAQKSWSIRQEFTDKVNAGDFEGAAARMGTEASGTQFFFGLAEQSEMIRNAGMMGRLVLQFGNFTNQFAWRTARELKNRPWRDPRRESYDPMQFTSIGTKANYAAKLAFLAMLPGFIGGRVGWEEMKRYNWFRSFTFGGGTFVDPMLNMAHSNTGIRKVIAGEPLSPEERFAMGRFQETVMGVPVNPYGSTSRTIGGYLNVLRDPNPVEAFFRMTLTGYSGSAGTDRFLDDFTQQLREATEGDIQDIPFPEDRQVLPSHFPGQRRTTQLGISEQEWQQFLEMLSDRLEGTIGAGPMQ